MLYWDQDGYALWYKRLEEGTFRLPAGAAAGSSASGGGCGAGVELKASELAMLLAGIDLRRLPRSRRFSRPAPAQPHASA